MARLNSEEFLDRIRAPRSADHLRAACQQEDKLVFHCEPVLENKLLPITAKTSFLGWVASFLPKDKMLRFQQMLTLPVDTAESTKAIFDELSKFLDAQDRYINFEFISESIAADFEQYREQIADENFWRTHGLQAMRTRINSLLIVDCPAVQTTSRPEPYYYFVSIHQIRDVLLNAEDGRVEYVVFQRREDNAMVAIDDEFYRVYVKNTDSGEYKLDGEARHSTFTEGGQLLDGLGYCPATSFFANPIHNSGRLNNRGPITDVLGKLDWLLFWRTSKKYLDLYGAYPIIVSYSKACEYKDAAGNACHEGLITGWQRDPVSNNDISVATSCPACTAKQEIGPGSWWEVDPPATKDEANLMDNPIRIIEISNDKLNYGVTEIIRLEDEVYLDCVGYDGGTMNNQAVNETQVSANFESKKTVLDGIKKQFERSHRFVMETVCRLRYADYFKSATVDYGNDYFLKSAADLTEEYTAARDAGMPTYYLTTLRAQVSRTRFRSNPIQLQRDEILAQLEPYGDWTIDQLVSAQIPTLDPLGFIIKLNFSAFVARFEREQTDIIQFGSLLPFGNKINLISQKLNDYGQQSIEKQLPAGPRTEAGPTGANPAPANG